VYSPACALWASPSIVIVSPKTDKEAGFCAWDNRRPRTARSPDRLRRRLVRTSLGSRALSPVNVQTGYSRTSGRRIAKVVIQHEQRAAFVAEQQRTVFTAGKILSPFPSVQWRSTLPLQAREVGGAMGTILTNGTCDICGCNGWTLMFRGQRCLCCIRAGNSDATLSVAPPTSLSALQDIPHPLPNRTSSEVISGFGVAVARTVPRLAQMALLVQVLGEPPLGLSSDSHREASAIIIMRNCP
jgi:hypothetical protein